MEVEAFDLTSTTGERTAMTVSAIHIAVVPGDGIGQEVMPVAVEAVRAAVAPDGVEVSF